MCNSGPPVSVDVRRAQPRRRRLRGSAGVIPAPCFPFHSIRRQRETIRKSHSRSHVATRERHPLFVLTTSHIEPKVHHVTFVSDIFLAFQPKFARLTRASLALA